MASPFHIEEPFLCALPASLVVSGSCHAKLLPLVSRHVVVDYDYGGGGDVVMVMVYLFTLKNLCVR